MSEGLESLVRVLETEGVVAGTRRELGWAAMVGAERETRGAMALC